MIRLADPEYSYEQTLQLCLDGITGNPDLHHRVTNAEEILLSARDSYFALANSGRLYTNPPITSAMGDMHVIANISKSELVNLYGTYFRDSEKPGRVIYNALMLAANEKCPYCGGIGRPRNLDHYLPKANFPQFSVLPWNLVPACRDCNMEDKTTTYATIAGDQIIQPYLDDSKFFDEQWIKATYHPKTPDNEGFLEYFVEPPNEWSDTDKQRCEKHFTEFNLAVRYSIEAGSELVYVEPDWLEVHQGLLSKDFFINTCQKVIQRSPFINHWKRVMYQALINSV